MDDLRKTYRAAVIVGLAMMASVFMYALIVELIRKGAMPLSDPELTKEQLKTLKFSLYGLSAVVFFLIGFVNRRMLASEDTPGNSRDMTANQAGAALTAQRLMTSAVVSYALCEAPAIFGLVVFFLGRDVMDFYAFVLVSLFFFSRYFPKYSRWEELMRGGRGAPGPGRR